MKVTIYQKNGQEITHELPQEKRTRKEVAKDLTDTEKRFWVNDGKKTTVYAWENLEKVELE